MTNAIKAGIAERLGVSEEEWKIVSGIMAEFIPGRTVWAFGSRATGVRVKRFSDLDLAVAGRLDGGRGAVMEAFDESLLRFKVDVVELALADEEFRARIEKDFVVVQSGVAGERLRED